MEVDINGEVSMGDVQTVYAQMEQGLGNNFKSGDETVIIFSDVALDSVVGGTAYLSGTNGFSSGIARNYVPFGEDDDWIWGTITMPLAGKCDGSDMSSDGSNELEWRLNNPMPVPTEQIFYINLETRGADGFYFSDFNSNPRLYVGWNYPEDNCLTNDTLTYYLNQSDDIFYTLVSNGGLRPSNKSFGKTVNY